MASAEEFLSRVSQSEHESATGDALKNGVYGADPWFVKNMPALARKRIERFTDKVKKDFPRWDVRYTILLLTEGLLQPSRYLPGVKAFEVPFNTILKLNEKDDKDRPLLQVNRGMTISEGRLGFRLVLYGITPQEDDYDRWVLEKRVKGEPVDPKEYRPRIVSGKYKTSGSERE